MQCELENMSIFIDGEEDLPEKWKVFYLLLIMEVLVYRPQLENKA